ncbi:MAG: hypothetical protein ACREM2_09100, partial [Vulcanimicrobiaceae bacterium]
MLTPENDAGGPPSGGPGANGGHAAPLLEEHDACGVGFLADLGAPPSNRVVRLALAAAAAMMHRGARAADGRT